MASPMMDETGMALPEPNPARVLSEPAPMLPQASGGMRGGTNMGPAPSPAPTSPQPAPAPTPMAEPAPTGQFLAEPPPEEGMSENGTGSLIGQSDSRYADPGWTVMIDTMLGGTMPWLMATLDVAQGRVPSDQFDRVRQEHEMRLEEVKTQHPQFVEAAEQAMPLLSGVIVNIAKPAKTVMGAAGRGSVAGGAVGAVQGYTGADPNLPSDDPDRMASAMGGAGRGATMGAVGGAVTGGVQKGLAARAEVPDNPSYSSTVGASPEDIAAKRAAQEARFEQRLQADLQAIEQRYTSKPQIPGANWQVKQKEFLQDPITAYRQQSERNPSLEKWAEELNMAPAAIDRKMRAAGFPEPTSDNERRLRQQFMDMTSKRKAVKDIKKGVPEQERLAGPTETKQLSKPAEVDGRPESVYDPKYKAPDDMRESLRRNMTGGKTPEAPKTPSKAPKSKKAGSSEDDELATIYRQKYDKKSTGLAGWQNARKAFVTDTKAFLKANPKDDLMTMAQRVNLSPRAVAERLRTHSLDDMPETLYDQVFEYDRAYKAAQRQARKAKK